MATHLTSGAAIGSSGTELTKILKGTVTVNLASIALAAVADNTVTLTGAAVGDTLIVNAPASAQEAGLVVAQAWVSATDTIKIRVHNAAGTDPLDPASVTFNYCLIRA